MSDTDRQRTFKRFNPDQRCCQCMCGDKYRTDVLDTTFSWNNPGGGTVANLDEIRHGWFGGKILGKYSFTARREWAFRWRFTAALPVVPFTISTTTKTVLLGVCLVRVIVLKNGDFFIPQDPANFDAECNVIGSSLGDFGANYTNYPHEPLTTKKVLGGGGLHHTQNFFSYKGGAEGSETDCEFIIPAELDNACARWDFYTASFWQDRNVWAKGAAGESDITTSTEIIGYHSSICRTEEYAAEEPPSSTVRTLGFYYTDRFISTLPASTEYDYPAFPSVVAPASMDGPGNVTTPAITASTDYKWKSSVVAEGTEADADGFEDAGIYEVFDAC